MKIDINDNISFDTELSFINQSGECIEYLTNIMNTIYPKVVNNSDNHPVAETWFLDGNMKDYAISRITDYSFNQAKSITRVVEI